MATADTYWTEGAFDTLNDKDELPSEELSDIGREILAAADSHDADMVEFLVEEFLAVQAEEQSR